MPDASAPALARDCDFTGVVAGAGAAARAGAGAGAICVAGVALRACGSGAGAISVRSGTDWRMFAADGFAAATSAAGAACSACHGRSQPIAMPAPTSTAASKP
ncbi:MAG: hypothetical protein EPO19_12950 [Betaproteobacteria bacterium]|nr:MAG: hypothetical protein EPO19_12950 [Betaproteobacteria bacterium]